MAVDQRETISIAAVEAVAGVMFNLARDEVPFGKIEAAVRKIEARPPGETYHYRGAAEPMGEWARRTAERLLYPQRVVRLLYEADKVPMAVLADADIVIDVDGKVIKDRHGIGDRQATPEEMAMAQHEPPDARES